jgi:hypothetical protein
VDGDAITSGVTGQAGSPRFLKQGKIRGDRLAPRPQLCERWIREGEVVNDLFVGPLAGVVTARSIGGSGGARRLGAPVGRPKWSRICRTTARRSITAMIFIGPAHCGPSEGLAL